MHTRYFKEIQCKASTGTLAMQKCEKNIAENDNNNYWILSSILA